MYKNYALRNRAMDANKLHPERARKTDGRARESEANSGNDALA